MNSSSLIFDTLFIFISALVLIGINYFGDPALLGKYSILVAISAYFIGKAVKKYEVKKK
jgi:hypothetical protein